MLSSSRTTPNYACPTWLDNLTVTAIVILLGTINIFGAKVIPNLQYHMFAFHATANICSILPT